MGERTKVAVLGGGVGSIVAAFELTRPGVGDRFEVTVYQQGWRLGGKGASGRDRDHGDRILEHGLHVWFGFYDEAWKAMRDAYEELARPPDAPLATLDDAFTACDEIVLYDRQEGKWQALPRRFPSNGQRPGDPHPLPTFLDVLKAVVKWTRTRFDPDRRRLSDMYGRPPAPKIPPDVKEDAARIATPADHAAARDDIDLVLLAAQRLVDGDPATRIPAPERVLAHFLATLRDSVWKAAEGPIRRSAELRMLFTMFDTAATTVAGLLRDEVLDHPDGFDSINDSELCEWLGRHGAKEVTLGRTPEERAPVLRSVYDVAFGYVDGVIANANVAAGTALTDLMRLTFAYRGSVFYKMNAGMGDVVFAPFHEVLERRGVKFEFFNTVTNVGLSGDGTVVDTIDVVEQATVLGGAYSPLYDVQVRDGTLACWPAKPDWNQLESGPRLAEAGIDFELDPNPLRRESRTLRRGEDFDAVVLGISIASLRGICGELVERHEPFRRALDTAKTVRTQAFQLWLRRPAKALGWKHSLNSVAGAYVEPLDTYCDMTHLIPFENWGDTESIAYFCGVQDERDGEDQAAATERAKRDAIAFLQRDIGGLWPEAVAAESVEALMWDLLVDPAESAGEARFHSQYCRANTVGSERYVLTPAGTVKHRLSPAGFGVDNLVLAGDWTRTGVDGGCVEAAAISGVRAAHTLIGDDHHIPGEDPRWLRK